MTSVTDLLKFLIISHVGPPCGGVAGRMRLLMQVHRVGWPAAGRPSVPPHT